MSKEFADQHFATEHLLTNLKGRTVSSGFVTGVAQAAQFVLNLISIVVLARLLAPEDFGLLAMVLTIMALLRIFNDAGLSMATVQRDEITHAQVSNLFWVNLGLGGLVGLALAVSAPAIAWFYREPRLMAVTVALSSVFLISGSTVQHLAILKRQMRFKQIAFIQVSAAACSTLIGIAMAWRHYGYWSLVGVQVTTPLVIFLLTWFTSTWRPVAFAWRSGTRAMLHFGASITASNFIWSVGRSTDGMLIGRIYGSESLGLYNRASVLLIRPVEQFMTPLEAVVVPLLSRLITQPDRYRRVVLQIFEAVVLASFLFTGLLLALAQPITLVVLGPRWSAAAPIFAGFTLVALFTPVGAVSGWLLASQGRGRDFLRCSVIGSVVAVLSFFGGLPYGPVGVALAFASSCVLVFLPVEYYIVGRSGPVSTRDLWMGLLKHLPVWCVVCGSTLAVRAFWADSSPLLQLLVSAPVGIGAGIGSIWLLPPCRRVALDVFAILRNYKVARAA